MSTSLSWDPVAEPKDLNPLRNTWDDIAMPILRTLQEMEVEASSTGKGGSGATIGQIVERLGKDTNDVGPQLNSLESDGYVSVRGNTPTSGRPHRHSGIQLLPKGRRALGEWPADPVAALASALARALEEAGAESGSAEERSRLKALAKKVRDAGPAIGLALVVEAAKAALGGT